ncbi:MAG: hypothetical protein M3Q14_02195, partial [bacterium]|nr:hypothetical protein [bacterium]
TAELTTQTSDSFSDEALEVKKIVSPEAASYSETARAARQNKAAALTAEVQQRTANLQEVHQEETSLLQQANVPSADVAKALQAAPEVSSSQLTTSELALSELTAQTERDIQPVVPLHDTARFPQADVVHVQSRAALTNVELVTKVPVQSITKDADNTIFAVESDPEESEAETLITHSDLILMEPAVIATETEETAFDAESQNQEEPLLDKTLFEQVVVAASDQVKELRLQTDEVEAGEEALESYEVADLMEELFRGQIDPGETVETEKPEIFDISLVEAVEVSASTDTTEIAEESPTEEMSSDIHQELEDNAERLEVALQAVTESFSSPLEEANEIAPEIIESIIKLERLLKEQRPLEDAEAPLQPELIEILIEVLRKADEPEPTKVLMHYAKAHSKQEFIELIQNFVTDYKKLIDNQQHLLASLQKSLAQARPREHRILGSLLLLAIGTHQKIAA